MIPKLSDRRVRLPATADSNTTTTTERARLRHFGAAVLASALLIVLLALQGCSRESAQTVLSLRGDTMGTTYSIQVARPPADLDSGGLAAQIDASLEEINGLMSTYRPGSELSRFNASASTDWIAVSPELVKVVDAALRVSRESDGAFDVTVGPVVNLWGFGPEVSPDALPTDTELADALARVGWQRLATRQQPPALRKRRSDLYVDLSAIAKGYAVDRVAELIERSGIDDYLVEIGGELRGRGVNGRGEPWRIAIERPEAQRRSVFRIVALEDSGMATSGDYRNFFEVDGERFSHTIDPASGRPVGHQLASVTVLDASTMIADAWATALLVLGPARGMLLAERLGLAVLFIEHAGDGFDARSTEAFRASSTDPAGGD